MFGWMQIHVVLSMCCIPCRDDKYVCNLSDYNWRIVTCVPHTWPIAHALSRSYFGICHFCSKIVSGLGMDGTKLLFTQWLCPWLMATKYSIQTPYNVKWERHSILTVLKPLIKLINILIPKGFPPNWHSQSSKCTNLSIVLSTCWKSIFCLIEQYAVKTA